MFAHSFAKFLPSRMVTNTDLEKLMDTSDEWITSRTGIKTRYWSSEQEPTSFLATEAAKKSLNGSKVDAIVACTLSPDFCFPGIGVQIQHNLGLTDIPAYDIRNQCSGFLYGLEMANAFVKSKQYKRVLLIGAEVHSTGLDISSRGRDIAVLFGDGAGSCIVENTCRKGYKIVDTVLGSDGGSARELWCEHPGSAKFPSRLTEEMIKNGEVFPYMNGRRVFENAVKRMVETSLTLLKKHNLAASDISLLIPHQANIRINQVVAEKLGVASNSVVSTIQRYGNTTAATIPIGFVEADEQYKPKAGSFVLSCAFGSGFTWGAALFEVVND